MLNPAQSDDIVMDTTSSLVVNNIARLERFSGAQSQRPWPLPPHTPPNQKVSASIASAEKGFSGVEVLNLYSLLTSKLNFRWNSDEDLNLVRLCSRNAGYRS